MPKGERSYHGLNLITNPGASIARGIGIRSEKPMNGFFQPGSSYPGRTPSTDLHGVIYNIDISAATKTAHLKEGQLTESFKDSQKPDLTYAAIVQTCTILILLIILSTNSIWLSGSVHITSATNDLIFMMMVFPSSLT
ncbi:TPA: hypothetical protein ACJGSF_005323 [Salmonella enterica subsp. enterica serovar Muenchen]|uniref:hypothetical protein n=1 Tax=Salmonella sp. SG203 TaxID=2555397 RepID=UPI0015826786|nr:hypothetical protein [Salmonella sp. SG203]HAF5680564.1 hypothetical protein [Salmonella enterica]HEC7608500.1 hypothetical protein [Salmonella enterica subsp. enterica serovar Muenchen]